MRQYESNSMKKLWWLRADLTNVTSVRSTPREKRHTSCDRIMGQMWFSHPWCVSKDENAEVRAYDGCAI
jgi:hypothetical protein